MYNLLYFVGFDSCFFIHVGGFNLFLLHTFVAVVGSSFIIICFLSRFEKMLNEMLSHLERQPRNKERCIAWLKFIEPIFNAIGLLLLAHFRHIFPLFFQWMHVDDDETVLLVRLLYLLAYCKLQFNYWLKLKSNYQVLVFFGKLWEWICLLTFQCSAGSQTGSNSC